MGSKLIPKWEVEGMKILQLHSVMLLSGGLRHESQDTRERQKIALEILFPILLDSILLDWAGSPGHEHSLHSAKATLKGKMRVREPAAWPISPGKTRCWITVIGVAQSLATGLPILSFLGPGIHLKSQL